MQFSYTEPVWWKERCSVQKSLFDEVRWHKVLQRGLNCSTVYFWDGAVRFPVTIFRAGPFRIGYVSFPAGAEKHLSYIASNIEQLRKSDLPVDLLRVAVSGFSKYDDIGLVSMTVPESAITDLQSWTLLDAPKLKRNLRKAENSGLSLTNDGNVNAEEIYSMYRTTIQERGGSLRYTASYFKALLDLSKLSDQLNCICSFQDGALRGFVVAALDSNRGYYLHGATDRNARITRNSDLMLYKALVWAQERGMSSFNFMGSPASQPGLIRYKEKFGAETRMQHVYEIEISPLRAFLFKYCFKAYGVVTNLRHGIDSE